MMADSTSKSGEAIQIATDRSTVLYCTKTSCMNGEIEVSNGRLMALKADASLRWDVSVPEDGTYELYATARVANGVESAGFTLKTAAANHDFTLTNSGDFRRIQLATDIALKKGEQSLEFVTQSSTEDKQLLDIRSLELLPLVAKKVIEADNARALAARASVEWLRDSGYGLMFHWTSQSVQRDGSIKSFADAVDAFDVERFADMVEQTGAGYVMVTIGHAESYCPAPIKSWEAVHPGHTTKRDLIAEMADALEKRNVRFICYINGPLGFDLEVKRDDPATDAEKQAFVTNFKSILTEMGNRYKEKVAGYWFDSWYQIFEEYPEVPFEEFNKAAKTGNPDRIFCLNSWIYPPVSNWQDYWAGEVGSPVALPVDGMNTTVDLPYQALLIMEPYWVQQKAEMPEPRFTSDKLADYIKDCMKHRGAVTINLGIYQDGTVGEKALQVMKEVKEKVR